MSNIGATTKVSFGESLLAELNRSKQTMGKFESPKTEKKSDSPSFQELLTSSIKKTNEIQKQADVMTTELVTGKEQNIHETMLAATQAELSFNLMVQIRNKALEAYQEIMRMPV